MRTLLFRNLVCLMLGLGLWAALPALLSDMTGRLHGVALADDDDGGDDGGDDDDGGRAGGNDRDDTPRRTRRARSVSRVVPPPPVPPAFAPAELIVTDLSEADLAQLLSEGFTSIERRPLAALATDVHRLGIRPGTPLSVARDRVRQLATGRDADYNHYYRTDEARTTADPLPPQDICAHENCRFWQGIGWPSAQTQAGVCRVAVPIGLIDTGINPGHEILAGARLQILPHPDRTGAASQSAHGTAVASLLVGRPDSRVPGLLPGAEVLAVDVFSQVQGDARAEVPALIQALDMLAARQVRLINLSLSGPENTVLSRMLDRLTDPAGLDAVIVAAAGNGGPTALPAWPGAHHRVISVTALDGRGRVFREAQRGDHLALSAPGVSVLAATSISGARAKSGTSFAAPFVTAAAALVLSQPEAVPAAQVRQRLFDAARDLGAPGRDPVFGFGALSATGLCATENVGRTE